MLLNQLSIFLENESGSLDRVLEVLVEGEISIRGYCISDTADFGILRVIVDNCDKAIEVLRKNSIIASKSCVIALKLNDSPGELHRLISTLYRGGYNIEYSYSLVSTYIAVRTNDNERACRYLIENNFEIAEADSI